MPNCILHVGMPKTGTSSIQESLFFGLSDPAFRLIGLGDSNAVRFLEPLFGDNPADFWVYRRNGFSSADVRRLARDYERRLRAALRRTRAAAATPIISAERCWAYPSKALERFRDFVAEEGFGVQVIAYLRPLKSWLESSFQQEAKLLNQVFDFQRFAEDVRARPGFWYARRLADLERIFGRESLTIRLFSRSALVGGCAVRDFCATLGIAHDDSAIIRVNDSISADAVRMLHCFKQFDRGGGRLTLWANQLLAKRLEGLVGGAFRFHSSVLAPLASDIGGQEREVLDRYGIDLREDTHAADNGPCVRDASDLLRFSRASLDWLARMSGRAPIAECEGEATARMVAEQVAAIARRPAASLRFGFLRYRLRRSMRWMRHGD